MGYLLHHYLRHAVLETPGAIALIAPDATLTYRELDERSNRLANVLAARGIAKGDRVGIELDKCSEAIVAIYAILKVGAAYVPLDPKAPVARKAMIATDCAIRGIVTSKRSFASLATALSSTLPCIVVTDAAAMPGQVGWNEVLSADAVELPDPGTIELDLAYILYTSGTTGVPKGVMLSHRAAMAFVDWATSYFGLRPSDRLSNHAPLHFDLSVFDIFCAAAAGGSVALVPSGIAVFPRSLAKWIDETGITIWYSVPSALVQLVLHANLRDYRFRNLRKLLFAGEVFPVAHLRDLMSAIPGATYYNLYGPTETNVCTVHEVPAELPATLSSLPIGRACANTELLVLDVGELPEGGGAVGELVVRGPALTQGYWGQQALSEKVLIPHPRNPDRTERLYRTGDLVRRDESGDYHFLGRLDLQVKSRGYRIELGEVEARLHQHPDVIEAVALPVPHAEFGCVLLAIVVLRPERTLDRLGLAAYCAARLPQYMVPVAFRHRDHVPKTSTGKVDRRALQEQLENEPE